MKTLTLLRHAKSGWDDPATRDFDRPLNPRGRKAARTVGREMRGLGLAFDQVVASPAVRVVETLDEVGQGYGEPLDVEYDQRIYLASAATLMDVIHDADDEASRLLIVGHNPGIENLALALAKHGDLRGELGVKYPTGTLAEIALPADRWTEVAEGIGTLTRFIRPRDLDPELGPDEDSY